MPLDPAVLESAKAKAAAFALGGQALTLWASVQRDVLATSANARAQLAANVYPAVVADGVRRQGTALAALCSKATPRLDAIKAALALPAFGQFSDAEVQQPHDLMLALCGSLRDAAQDASDLLKILDIIDATLSATGLLF